MYEDVDLRNPIANVPANAGLRFWWLGLPGVSGGKTAFDLGPWRHRGALTGFGAPSSTSGWVPTGRGDLGVAFDGSDDYAQGATDIPIGGDPAFTIAAWVRMRSTMACGVLGWGKSGTPLGVVGWWWNLRGSGVVSTEYAGNTAGWVAVAVGSGWRRLVYTKSPGVIATTGRWYVDGADLGPQDGSSFAGTPNVAASPLRLGQWADYGSDRADCDLADVQIFARAWTPAEVAADYRESRQGYPTRLNRVSDWRYAEQFSGGVGLVGPGLVGCNPLISYGGLCW